MALLFQNNIDLRQFSKELAVAASLTHFSSRKFSLEDSLLNSSKDFIQ
ncbi:hypothetical protein ACFSJU_12135 [Paradesertivirga mongoliensis]|uniref:Uncharacterized protein n=1 Tax=Paradesertivirga mongoliensis TaxID=2100740 RepID=A0ABW4ZMI3_9SPHI|nr:hypothetical protein [Pedobacter mongoliensis]